MTDEEARRRLTLAVRAAFEHFDDQIHCRKPRMHPLDYSKMLRDTLRDVAHPSEESVRSDVVPEWKKPGFTLGKKHHK